MASTTDMAAKEERELHTRLRTRSPEKNQQGTNLSRAKFEESSISISTAPPRTSTKDLSPSETQLGSAEIFEPGRTTEKKLLPQEYSEGSTQIHSSSSEAAKSQQEREFHMVLQEQCATADKLKASQKECKQLRVEIADLYGKLRDSETNCSNLANQLVAVQSQLTETADFVFSLNRRESKLSSSDAAEEFNSLCGTVEDWVQRTLGDALSKFAERPIQINPLTKEFLKYIPLSGREAFGILDTDECNIVTAILRFLGEEVFGRDFYCPITKGAMPFLMSIGKAMKNLEPPRDHITMRTWQSETFTALAQRPEFAKTRQHHSDKLSADLASMLSVFAHRCEFTSFCKSIQRAIIEPALNLAHKMHLSVDEFEFRWTRYSSMSSQMRRPLSHEAHVFECFAHSPNGNKKLAFPVDEEYSITYLFDLSPELVFREAKPLAPGELKVLKRGRVLVAVTKDQQDPYSSLQARQRGPVTVLGHLQQFYHSRAAGQAAKKDSWWPG